MGWVDDETFQFFVPAQIVKSKKADKKGEEGKRWIQGIASTSSRDLQGEIVDQNGIDLSYFLANGWFNNDHRPGFANKVGQPYEARITKNGLWVKGFLLKNHKVADEIWELMNSLEASQSDRRIGFSIQGKVKRREGNVIKECWIQDIAITPAPINTSTWAEIAKSLSAQRWDLGKAMEAGAGNNPVVPESLEEEKKDVKDKEDTSKALSFEEAVSFLKSHHGLPEDTAVNVAKAIFLTSLGEDNNDR